MNKHDATLLARSLRKKQTNQEKRIWNRIKNRNLGGFKFNRQKVIHYVEGLSLKKYFIVDFYCAEQKLILEIDGRYHQGFKEHDTLREDILKIYGFRIIRFTNEEIDVDIESVLSKILDFVKNDGV